MRTVNGKKSWSTKFCPTPAKNGVNGTNGINGANGKDGSNGTNGANGLAGANGKSVFDLWRDGNEGGIEEMFASFVGPQGEQGERGPVGPVGPQGEVGPQGPIGVTGERGPRRASPVRSTPRRSTTPGNTNEGAIAAVACNASSSNYTAITGGVQVLASVAHRLQDGRCQLAQHSGVSSFPGRMDSSTNSPRPNRLDGWIVQFGGNAGPVADEMPAQVIVWALCVPRNDIPVHTTFQQVDLTKVVPRRRHPLGGGGDEPGSFIKQLPPRFPGPLDCPPEQAFCGLLKHAGQSREDHLVR